MLTPEAPGLLQALQEAASAVNGARTEYNALTAARNTLERKAVEARGEVGYFTMQLSDLDHADEILRSSEEDLLRHYKLLHGLEEKAEASSKAETKAEFDLQVHTRTLDVLKRARKRHLSTYLGRIESQANANLDIIGAKPRIALDLTDGKLEVLATGTGAESYRCLSSGEQRRVDLCLLLAMSRVAADVGTVPTAAPMVIDEAFDTLDEAGVEALLFLACEEAKHRQVFLVSHIEPPHSRGYGWASSTVISPDVLYGLLTDRPQGFGLNEQQWEDICKGCPQLGALLISGIVYDYNDFRISDDLKFLAWVAESKLWDERLVRSTRRLVYRHMLKTDKL